MEKQKIKNVFIKGAITPEFIAESIAKHQSKIQIGAHDIFLGQVRADDIQGKTVTGIEYSAYEEMANLKFHEIKEATFNKYELSCLHIYHSMGVVQTGEICLFVFVSSPHRKAVFEALHTVVEEIKKEVPVFGKELFGDDSYQWKVNK
ncbi:molybdenum cofactor biosynthesis protein MoaE [Muriicola sp. Z0-33]|uniref:molybdenum cofactor biosynthesis protein MoaE n=1 Tax=Muriicola sp. Z0-33 TaxID=2816957 RepID=UPI0022377B94|nr:molybdenum cofactor biosynthesis protein MoaE [Muriicola sp. Z0-33]MCW5517768.1 molybdenum cofactor biosynthesis protein MoaE [Muriicola sp. Z0-33]